MLTFSEFRWRDLIGDISAPPKCSPDPWFYPVLLSWEKRRNGPQQVIINIEFGREDTH